MYKGATRIQEDLIARSLLSNFRETQHLFLNQCRVISRSKFASMITTSSGNRLIENPCMKQILGCIYKISLYSSATQRAVHQSDTGSKAMNDISMNLLMVDHSQSPVDDPPIDPVQLERQRNIGNAIEVLRYQLPQFFSYSQPDKQSLCSLDYSIYDRDILLIEPHHYRFHVQGLYKYRFIMNGARNVLRFYFSSFDFKIVNIVVHRSSQVSDCTPMSYLNSRKSLSADVQKISIHWKFSGIPRTSYLNQWLTSSLRSITSPFSSHADYDGYQESQMENGDKSMEFEGIFVYRFDQNKHALINQHSIENVIPAPRKFAPLKLLGWFTKSGKMAVEFRSNQQQQ